MFGRLTCKTKNLRLLLKNYKPSPKQHKLKKKQVKMKRKEDPESWVVHGSTPWKERFC